MGSRVGGQHKDKKQRITEALSDLRLVFAGMADGGEGRRNAGEMMQSTASLARACAVFLRKVVLGEARNREARLLDDDVLDSLEMRLQPLRRIPKESRRTIETGFDIEQVALQITRLDDATGEPKERYVAAGECRGCPSLSSGRWWARRTGQWCRRKPNAGGYLLINCST